MKTTVPDVAATHAMASPFAGNGWKICRDVVAMNDGCSASAATNSAVRNRNREQPARPRGWLMQTSTLAESGERLWRRLAPLRAGRMTVTVVPAARATRSASTSRGKTCAR